MFPPSNTHSNHNVFKHTLCLHNLLIVTPVLFHTTVINMHVLFLRENCGDVMYLKCLKCWCFQPISLHDSSLLQSPNRDCDFVAFRNSYFRNLKLVILLATFWVCGVCCMLPENFVFVLILLSSQILSEVRAFVCGYCGMFWLCFLLERRHIYKIPSYNEGDYDFVDIFVFLIWL